ncbi:MAG: ATP-binding cassette domain-containing protein [Spirochaetales bacterium]|nr:ATP-binding cassette domain-containing protein [Spirochaetales bacterium]
MSVRVSIKKRVSSNFRLEAEFQSSGECLGILGASGCGKSMTLKCIAGIETPDEGHISLNGRVVFDSAKKINLRPQARRVGYLFQSYALFPRMTVGENITAGLPFSRRERCRVAGEWTRRFGLGGLEGRYPDQLSGGQQQRTALARMLCREPEVILLDEPFSALDTFLREQMQVRLLELLESRRDVIMVTHNRDEAYKLCPQMLVMDEGRVLKKGRTREMFLSPGSVQAARLTGCKNISPITRTGEREVFARDWGLTLRTAEPPGEDITHAGIRAHDLVPLWEDGPEAARLSYNVLDVAPVQRAEDPFEHIVLFTNAAARGPEEKGLIWWKCSKYMFQDIPKRLFIPPELILLLRDDNIAGSLRTLTEERP